jgi:hypothetical protein
MRSVLLAAEKEPRPVWPCTGCTRPARDRPYCCPSNRHRVVCGWPVTVDRLVAPDSAVADVSRAGRRDKRRAIMPRAFGTRMAVSAAFMVEISLMTEGLAAGRFAASVKPVGSEAGGLVVRVHGTHRPCRHGSQGRTGMQVGWHRHDRGAVYPCAPESTGAQPYSSPADRSSRQGSGPGTPGSGQSTAGGTAPEKKTGVTAIPKIVSPPPRNSVSTPPSVFSPSTSAKRR